MKINKLYTTVEVTCNHSRYDSFDMGFIEFIEKFELANPNFEIINGTVEWAEEYFYFLAKEL